MTIIMPTITLMSGEKLLAAFSDFNCIWVIILMLTRLPRTRRRDSPYRENVSLLCSVKDSN